MERRTFILAAGALGMLSALRLHGADLGKRAPLFQAVDTASRKRTLAEFAGKTVVLEWSSPTCPYVTAQYESGVMQELQRWATSRGVVWLTVLSAHPSRSEYLGPKEAQAYLRAREGAPTALLLDASGNMGRAYDAVVTPHMFVIAPDGTLAYAGGISDQPTRNADVARKSRNFVKAALEDLAAGRPVATPSSRPFGCTIAYSGR